MPRSLICFLIVGLVVVAAAGCGQYLGYRVESTKEVERKERVLTRGEPRELKIEIRSADRASPFVSVQAEAVREDRVAEVAVTEETRVHKYGKYYPGMDLFLEPISWGTGVVSGPIIALFEQDWRCLCLWPPVDLVARLCGSSGINSAPTMDPHYEDHRPCYGRRVAQWLGWVLPGYSLGRDTREETEVVRREEPGAPHTTRAAAPAAKARLTLRTSADPGQALEAAADSEGCARFDLSRHLNRTYRGARLTITAQAEYKGLTRTDQKVLDPADLGVTWDKPRFRPDAPPRLVVKAEFRDPNANGFLDAAEQAEIAVTVANQGKGEAFLLEAKAALEGEPNMVSLAAKGKSTIETLTAKQEHTFLFALRAEEDVPAQGLRARIEFTELNGFEPRPVVVAFSTRPYDKPELVVAKWEIDDDSLGMSMGNGDRVLQRGEQAEITVFVQNRGAGRAERVKVSAEAASPNVFVKMYQADLGHIEPGQWAKAVFTLMVNNRYQGADQLPLRIKVAERRPRFSLERPIEIALGKRYAQPQVVEVAGQDAQKAVKIEPLPEPRPATRARPVAAHTRPGRVCALIVGISEYQYGISRLEYAAKDARDMRDLLLAQGISSDNIKLLTDAQATKTNVQVATRSWLSRARDATVIVHWSGHGLADPNNPGQCYFACYDTPANGLTAGYKMTGFTDDLKDIKARHVVVLLDTCHAGKAAYRSDKGLGGIAAGPANDFARVMEDQQRIAPGMVIIAAGDADRKSLETSDWANGMLTHVVLRGLRGPADGYEGAGTKDSTITLGELKAYVQMELPKATSDLGLRACFPVIATLRGDATINNLPLARVKKQAP